MALDIVAADTRASASTESISVRPDFAVLRRVRPGVGAVIGTEEGNEFHGAKWPDCDGSHSNA